jgi:hypothetical protein
MLIFTQILLQLLGFALLSLSISRNYSKVIKSANKRQSKRTTWVFRACGYSLLILAVFSALNTWGLALGLVYSFAIATLTASFIVILLTYKSHYFTFFVVRIKTHK